ncbi:hypothetical protein FYK55_13540 [Roseiconus nitratireducens]|uniref:Secreted protein n=1 Tax=Roseiconus nitratireducens TaxID=2605748 RepID=A0A5M6D4Z5_9BACT|nr:hypothetical protein [Roseiconus nitratireducens]KAA5542561.1 hypothetical protein FYK55_13540 [Roseiconus nitratireducens]
MITTRIGFHAAIRTGSLVGLLLATASFPAAAQEPAADPAAAKDPSTQQQTEFAPGVVTVIPGDADPEETFDGPLTLQGFLDAHPELEWNADTFPDGSPHYDPRSRTLVEMAKQVVLRREIYCLEFSFKPLRQMYVDVPVGNGQTQRKLVWYMVYRVRYRGGDLRPAADEIGGSKLYQRLESVSYDSRRFFPLATLKDQVSGQEYLDRILPNAKEKIAVREQISAPLFNSVEISRQRIPRSTDDNAPGVWGVLTWMDVDPNIDYLSVYVSGLTNAFEQDGEGPDAPYRRKALQLNFYRPGDAMAQTEDLIRFGIPAFEDQQEQDYVLDQYNLEERLDYLWVFRPLK